MNSMGKAQTQCPTTRNDAVEFPPFGEIAGVSTSGVQWNLIQFVDTHVEKAGSVLPQTYANVNQVTPVLTAKLLYVILIAKTMENNLTAHLVNMVAPAWLEICALVCNKPCENVGEYLTPDVCQYKPDLVWTHLVAQIKCH
ncbi:von Willebrand factor D and EGF domain-containing protein [Manis javanica]|nr:von Willebrand factor D and EGF domain-containing protein [Manis javanica]